MHKRTILALYAREVRQAGSNPVSRQWACSISAQTGHGVT